MGRVERDRDRTLGEGFRARFEVTSGDACLTRFGNVGRRSRGHGLLKVRRRERERFEEFGREKNAAEDRHRGLLFGNRRATRERCDEVGA